MPILQRAVSTTTHALAQITVNVPSMGNSFTEGTIVEWCIPLGSRVKDGDVLALVETDKVTVDIKADRDGILVRQLGEVEGVVEVGQGLYVLEMDAVVAATAAVGSNNIDVSAVDASLDAGEAAAVVVAAAAAATATLSPVHKKSIQFLEKEGWKARMVMAVDDHLTTLQREKIKVEYRISHLSKIVRTLSPPTDFSLAVPSPPGIKIIRSNIEYCAALMPNISSAAYPFSLVLDCCGDRRPLLLSTSLSSRCPLYSTAARCSLLTVIARRRPLPRAPGRPQQCPQIMADSP
jgi:hypothetical protein